MDDNLKILYGVAVKLLYSEQVLAKLSEGLESSQKPVEVAGQMLAMIMQRAIANAQKAGAQLKNDTVMKALALLVKETVNILGGKGELKKEQSGELAKVLVASALRGLKQLTDRGQGQGGAPGGVSPAQPQAMAAPAAQAQPTEAAPVSQQAPRGLIGGAMQGGM